jgi:Tol biopolymer transport system component
VPNDVDITTADSGSQDRYPSPPDGVSIRRLTHTHAEGIVRGTPEGDRVAYYAKGADGLLQIFIIASDGSDRDPDPAKRPVQATRTPGGAGPGLRWHPSGNSIAYIADNHVAVTCVKPGPRFGETQYLTPSDDAERSQLVWSPDGRVLALNKPVPTYNENGAATRADV